VKDKKSALLKQREWLAVGLIPVLLSATFLLPLSLFTSAAYAAPNPEINYQGKLTNASNVAVPDGTYHMRFWLLTSPTAATTTAIWSEDRSTAAGDRVTVRNGLFSVMLGSSTPLTGVDFNQTLYLGVEVGGSAGSPSWDGEMSPRKILGTVPTAFEADRLDGLTGSQFLRSDAATTLSTSTASTLLTITQSGAGDILNIFDGSTEIFSILDGGMVGIGSTSPSSNFKLSISGNIYLGGNLTATGSLAVQGTGTSTFANGIDITDGCFAIDGVCFSGTPTNLFATTSIDSSADLASIVSDETGSSGGGFVVFSNGPTLTGITTLANASTTNMTLSGKFFDSAGSPGTNGYVLQTNGSAVTWVSTSSLNIAGGTGATTFLALTDTPSSFTDQAIIFSGSSQLFSAASFAFASSTNTLTVGGMTLRDALTTHTSVSTTTIPTNQAFAWTIATSTTGNPLFRIDTTAGSETVTLGTGSGDVYIGNVGSASNLIFEESSTISGQGGNTLTFGVSGDIINFGTNVGIGTTSPGNPLSVGGNSYFGGNVTATGTLSLLTTGTSTFSGDLSLNDLAISGKLYDNSNSAGTGGLVLMSTGTGISWVSTSSLAANFGTTSIDTSSELETIVTDNTGSGLLVFGTNATLSSTTLSGLTTLQNATSATLAVTGTSYFGGNVGVGTTTPNVSKFHVVGSASSLTDGALATFGVNSGGSGDSGLTIGYDTTNNWAWLYARTTGVNSRTINLNGSAFVNSSGNFGVGTSTPFAKLSIHANANDTNTTLFAIGSSTASATSTLFSISNIGNVNLASGATLTSSGSVTYGSGATTNITSGGNINLESNVHFNGNEFYVNGVGRIVFDNTTSAFPALGNSGSSLYLNLADGSTGGAFGIGTTSSQARFAIHATPNFASTTLFEIGSSTASATTTLFKVTNTGSTTIAGGLQIAQLIVTGNATSTFANGISLGAGCVSVNGACLSTGAGAFGTTSIDTSSELDSIVTDNTGSGALVFGTIPTLAGFISNASSTIGGGTPQTGLTVNGTATTTNLFVSSGSSLGTVSAGTWQGTAVADTYVSDAITVTGGTLGSNTIASGATWSTAGTLTIGDGGDRIDISSSGWDVTNSVITSATWNGSAIGLAYGGMGTDVSAYSSGLFGLNSGTMTDIDTESELETALGGLDVVTVTASDITSANLITALSDETGSGAAVFGTAATLASTTLTGRTTLQDATSTTFAVTGSATTTFANGISLSAGCFRVGGSCLTGGASTFIALSDTDQSSFTANRILHTNSGGTGLTDTAGFVFTGTNMGIGTTSPFSTLSVVGNIAGNHIIPNGPYTSNVSSYDLGSTSRRWNALWAGTVNIGTSTWSMNNGTNGRLSFYDAASGGGTERVSFLTSGYVGIGTTSPLTKLTVQATAGVAGFEVASSTGAAMLRVNSDGSLDAKLKQLTGDYVVDSKSDTIAVGDIVAYINGKAEKASRSVNSPGAPVAANSDFNSAYTSAAVLDSTHFVLTYIESSTLPYAVVASVSGTSTITYGTPVALDDTTSSYTSVAALDSTNFVVVYEGASDYAHAVVSSVSGTTITTGAPTALNSVGSSYNSVAALDSTHFVTAYRSAATFYPNAVASTISGTSTITSGTPVAFTAGSAVYTSVTAVDSTNFVTVYQSNVNGYAYAVISSVSGNTITAGAPTALNSVSSPYTSVAMLDSTRFVTAYRNNSTSYTNAVVSTISGTSTITAGTPVALNSDTSTYISVVSSNSTRFVVAYIASAPKLVVSTVSGTTITPSTPFTLHNVANSNSTSVTALGSTRMVTGYVNGSTGSASAIVASIAATSTQHLGMAVNAASANGIVTVASHGIVSGLSGLTAGSTYYWGFSTGLSTTTQTYKVGMALSSSSILLNSGSGAGADQFFGDMIFANNFLFTEGWDYPQSIIMKNQLGREILKIDEHGNLQIAGSLSAENVGPLTLNFLGTTTAAELTASTTATTTDGSLLPEWAGTFASSSARLRAGIETLADTVVSVLSRAVYATVGIFDKIFAKEVNTDTVNTAAVHTGTLDADTFCVSDETGQTCLAKSQVDALLAAAGVSAASVSDEVATSTDDSASSTTMEGIEPPTEDSAEVSDNATPEPTAGPEPISDPEADFEPTSEPEPTPEPPGEQTSGSATSSDPTATLESPGEQAAEPSATSESAPEPEPTPTAEPAPAEEPPPAPVTAPAE
jgi:hypothetical protein